MVGSCLAGKTIGIMGLGRIGLATAKRLKAFEPAKIIYTSGTKAQWSKFLDFFKILMNYFKIFMVPFMNCNESLGMFRQVLTSLNIFKPDLNLL